MGRFDGGSAGRFSTSSDKKEPNVFSRLIPDVIEDPVTAAVGGTVGLAGNLLGDVKDAVVGLPMGVVRIAQDPVESGKAIGTAMWHTWSPLFQGDIVKFAKQTYDHPLAPLLDVAAVFTLGAGSAARGASALQAAGHTGLTTTRLARLTKAKTVALPDPSGVGMDLTKTLSNRAGRRLVQEAMFSLEAKGKLPQFYVRQRYQRAKLVDMAHRAISAQAIQGQALTRGREIERAMSDGDAEYLASRTQFDAMLGAADALEDITELGKRARSTVIAHMHAGMARHNDAVDPDRAAQLVKKKGGHYVYLVAPEQIDSRHRKLLDQRLAAHSRATMLRSNAILRLDPKIEKAKAKLAELPPEQVGVQFEKIRRLEEKRAALDAGVQEQFTQLEQIRNRSADDFYNWAGDSYDGFRGIVNNFGRISTTTRPERAWHTDDGKVYVVPKHDLYNLQLEAGGSVRFLHQILHKPTQLWKSVVIGYTPRTVTNNAVGNWSMYMARELPSGRGMLALADALKYRFGPKVLDDPLFGRNHWLDRYFQDELADQFGVGNEIVKLGGDDLAPAATPLKGLPAKGKPSAEVQTLAARYMEQAGLPYRPPTVYAKVDKDRAEKIAQAYEQALDAFDPRATPEFRAQVLRSYEAMAKESLDQYRVLEEAGYQFEFMPRGADGGFRDPYGSPWDAMDDLRDNKHMYVYPTEAGFGSVEAASQHPLLRDSGVRWGGETVTYNDVFRAIHDVFGHHKEGVGFRWDGEENAWRAHSAMFSPTARKAMTAETRGQNSWVNFGPHGEHNRTASQYDTIYAEQKATILPDWVVNDGAGHSKMPRRQKRVGDTRLRRTLRQGFYPAVHAVAEKPLRVATLYKSLRDMPEVRAAIKDVRNSGLRGQRAVDTAIERVLKERPDLRDAAALSSRRLAGDYITMSEAEKWARDIIPFYLWSRHILKTTGNMALDQPSRLAVGARISELGIEETQELLGEIPDFLKGAIPLAALGGGSAPGRANVLLTSSLNPYATVGELAEVVKAFAAGDVRRGAAFSQLNPFITGAVESVTEQSLLTGAPSPRTGGVAADVANRTLLSLPYVKLLDDLTSPSTTKTAKGNARLFAKSDTATITSLLGVPIRNVGLATASAQAALEDDTKKKVNRFGGGA